MQVSKTNLYWQEAGCGRLNISGLGNLSQPVSMGAVLPQRTWVSKNGSEPHKTSLWHVVKAIIRLKRRDAS